MAGKDLFAETFQVINAGDCLIVGGGTFPGQNNECEITLDLLHIIPFMNVFYTASGNSARAAEHPDYNNPLGITETSAPVRLSRGDGRIGFDAEDPWFRYGKRAASIGEQVVDLVLIGPDLTPDFYFVSKPQE